MIENLSVFADVRSCTILAKTDNGLRFPALVVVPNDVQPWSVWRPGAAL